MRSLKQIFAASSFLMAGLLSVSLEAAEVEVVITDQSFDPDQLVLQAGDDVTFDSALRTQGAHTLVIVREGDESTLAKQFENGSWKHRFEEPGHYHLFVQEFPRVSARAVVFPRAGATADLRQEMVSYSIGYDLGRNVVKKLANLDLKLFSAGIEHAYTDQEPKLSRAEMDFIVKEYGREVARRARDERERIAALHLEESQKFLERNARQRDVVVLPSGLQYKILKRGSGRRPKAGTKVRVHHRATFLDGTEFDSTYESEPAEFLLTENVLPGYSEGLRLMSEGAKWKLFVPPQLAYGIHGQPDPQPGAPAIEPNATLIFEVELLRVGD
jgi:FKBP-type peptidyl-prolyl cis-trans isomerase FklB